MYFPSRPLIRDVDAFGDTMVGLVVPLANFETKLAEVDLGEGWQVRTLSPNELAFIRSNFPIAQHFSPQHLHGLMYALAQKCELSEQLSLDPRPAMDIVRAMRLLHAGDISTPVYSRG